MAITVEKIREYTGHKGSLFALYLHENNHTFYTAGDDGIVVQWDLNKPEDVGKGIVQVNRAVYSLIVEPDSNHIWVGTSDGTLLMVDTVSKETIHQNRKVPQAIYRLHHDRVSKRMWVLQGGGFLQILDTLTFESIFLGRLSEQHLRSICEDPLEDNMFIGVSDNRILIIDKKSIKVKDHWQAHENSVFSLAVHKEGKYLLSGGRDAHLNSWDLQRRYKLIRSLPAHYFTVNDIDITVDGSHIATASRDKTIKLWDAYTLDLLKVIDFQRNDGHKHSVNKLKWLKSDNSLISCGDDRRIIHWKVKLS